MELDDGNATVLDDELNELLVVGYILFNHSITLTNPSTNSILLFGIAQLPQIKETMI